MRTQLCRFKAAVAAATLCVASAISQAGLQVPYTPDASTLHLWHFDETATTGGVTNILLFDAVTTSPIVLTNLGQPNPGVPPYTNAFMGAPSFSGLTNALEYTDRFTIAYGGQFPDVSSFCDPNTSEFTFEAIVRFARNPLLLPNNMEILCGDQPGGIANRGWQFRVTTSGQLEFNLLGGSGSDNDFKFALPTTGPNAAVTGQWYHVAVTFSGTSPVNGDEPNTLRMYWTLLDANRTSADLLGITNMTRLLNGTTEAGAGTVQPAFGIGGSGRRIIPGGNGVGNGEGFIGNIDEVRISSVARASNEMAFVTGGALNPPTVTLQPPASTLIGYGRMLSLPALAVGSLPLHFQWQMTNNAGGFTNVSGQNEGTLTISNITFAASGAYRLVITNAYGRATSSVAQVTVGASFSELFNTGVDVIGALAGADSEDAHYRLISSSDPSNLGPAARVWNMFAYPIANQNGNFSNPNDSSQWIGPLANNYISPAGQYVYRISFLLDSVDLTKPVELAGLWYASEMGNDILVNGVSTGNSLPAEVSSAGKFSTPFVITNGFVPGINTLDFVTTRSTNANGTYQQSALRVEMSGVGSALAAGLPGILVQPEDETVRDAAMGGGSRAEFSVVALGRPPMSYQWLSSGEVIPDATNRTLRFVDPSTGAQGTSFQVVVSNDSGSVTSDVVSLTLTMTNHPPVAGDYQFLVATNGVLNVPLSTLLGNASDLDNDPLTLTYDTGTTNGAALEVVEGAIRFTAPEGFTGADQFSYTISDGMESVQRFVNITVALPLNPSVTATVRSGSNIIFSGTGGLEGSGFSVLSSTNLALPLANWTVESTGTFAAGGGFSVTNAINSGTPQRFYILRVP